MLLAFEALAGAVPFISNAREPCSGRGCVWSTHTFSQARSIDTRATIVFVAVDFCAVACLCRACSALGRRRFQRTVVDVCYRVLVAVRVRAYVDFSSHLLCLLFRLNGRWAIATQWFGYCFR